MAEARALIPCSTKWRSAKGNWMRRCLYSDPVDWISCSAGQSVDRRESNKASSQKVCQCRPTQCMPTTAAAIAVSRLIDLLGGFVNSKRGGWGGQKEASGDCSWRWKVPCSTVSELWENRLTIVMAVLMIPLAVVTSFPQGILDLRHI